MHQVLFQGQQKNKSSEKQGHDARNESVKKAGNKNTKRKKKEKRISKGGGQLIEFQKLKVGEDNFKSSRAERRISKFEGIPLNFLRAINNISETEGYDVKFRKLNGTKTHCYSHQ